MSETALEKSSNITHFYITGVEGQVQFTKAFIRVLNYKADYTLTVEGQTNLANLELLKTQVKNIIDKQLREAICKKIGLNEETAE